MVKLRSLDPLRVCLVLMAAVMFSACSDDEVQGVQCPDGQVFSMLLDRCVDMTTDADNDGVAAEDDCDDMNANLGARSADADCDSIPTAVDCDDTDASLGAIGNDADCDGVIKADECDDDDAMLGARADDMDCDGVATADDCDDGDAMLGATASDMDCDGIATADDCDDGDAMSTAIAADMDCDGVATAADCDDEDDSVGALALDSDCDGTVNTEDECPDDENFSVSPPPAVVSTFPTAAATTNAESLSVVGTVTLFCNNTLGTLSAAVNGTPTALQTEDLGNGQTRWRLSAALTQDAVNTISVSATDSLPRTATATVTVEQYSVAPPPALASSQGIAIDPATSTAFVSDEALPGVYAVNLATQDYRILTGAGIGTGDALTSNLEGGIAFDATNNRVLITDDGANSVVAVDPTSGARTTLSDASSDGAGFGTIYGIDVNASGTLAYVADSALDGVFEVDLTNGARTVLTGTVTGSGEMILTPRDVALDAANNRLLVIATNPDALFSVDLATGDRVVVSSATTGAGNPFNSARGVTLDPANNRALVADAGNGNEGIIAVDLATGDRTEISGQNEGSSIDPAATFDNTRGVVIDMANGRLVAVDDLITNLVAVDPISGDRTLIVPAAAPVPGVGAGPDIVNPTGLAYDPQRDVLYLADDGANAIVTVAVGTGDRSVLADNNSPGIVVDQPRGMGFDPANNRLLVPENENTTDAILGINLITGEGSIISGDDSPDEMSETFASPRGRVAIEPGGLTALVADTSRDSVFRFVLADGERTTLVEGGNRELEGVQNVAIDEANNRALATVASTGNDSVLDGLLAIDLTTGSTTTLASRTTDTPAVGTGVNMTNPRGLAFDEANNRALIFDADLDAVISLDLATLARTVLADASTGAGDLLAVIGNNTNFIELDTTNQRLFVVSEDSGQVVLIDLASGDQVAISR